MALQLLKSQFRIRAPFTAQMRRGRHSDFCEFPGEFRERLDASSTSNVLTTPKVREFPGIFPDNGDSGSAIRIRNAHSNSHARPRAANQANKNNKEIKEE
ncbi:hypothetical protein [Nocardia sp. NPDC052112]|uniref:hypothetical protein n=1 Tax=Nocardia sp. NPDC052112 TaxID=3155646 RepID=UPI0034451FED